MGLANFQKALEFLPLAFIVLRILLFSLLLTSKNVSTFFCLKYFISSVISPIWATLSLGNEPGHPLSRLNLCFSLFFISFWISTIFGGNLACLGEADIILEDPLRASFIAAVIALMLDTAHLLVTSLFVSSNIFVA